MNWTDARAAPQHSVIVVIGLQYGVLRFRGQWYRRVFHMELALLGFGSCGFYLALQNSLDAGAIKKKNRSSLIDIDCLLWAHHLF